MHEICVNFILTVLRYRITFLPRLLLHCPHTHLREWDCVWLSLMTYELSTHSRMASPILTSSMHSLVWVTLLGAQSWQLPNNQTLPAPRQSPAPQETYIHAPWQVLSINSFKMGLLFKGLWAWEYGQAFLLGDCARCRAIERAAQQSVQ